MSTTQIIKASYDSFVNEGNPTVTNADATLLKVRTDTGLNRFAYLYFPLSWRNNVTILSANLTITLGDAWSGVTLTARRITEHWKESTINHDNKPATTATGAATLAVTGAAGDAKTIDITTIVQAWANGSANYGVRLSSSSTALDTFYSSEAAPRLRPVLEVTWVVEPDAPTNLVPDDAQAFTPAAPLVKWDSTTPTYSQVQIHTSTDFSTPLFDSGYVANTETNYDTSTDASPPSLSANTTYYWRVRIKDDSGIASEWSATAEMQRRSHGTLTITEPTNDNDDVDGVEPTIEWTFTGRTQKFVKYELFEDGVKIFPVPHDGYYNQYNTRIASTATSFAIPDGYIKKGADYMFRLTVWDTYDRVPAGGTASVQAERIFQRVDDAGVTPVTNLAVVTEDGHMHITWTKVSAPDYFSIWVDDEKIGLKLDPADVLVSGNDYAYDFYSRAPQVSQTYKVKAHTAGKTSATNPSVSATFTPRGIWLVDDDTKDEVLILGQNMVSSEVGEVGGTFFPLGRRDPVRITDTVRGLEGTVSGTLMATSGRTVATERNTFESFKANPDGNYRILYGYRSFPVLLGECAIELASGGEASYNVEFDYFQVGDWDIDWTT